MAGHSHWAGIKHKKEIVDNQRGKVFSKLSKLITSAATSNPDPETNPNLRTIIEKARSENMPKDKIEHAIKKASGASASGNLEEVTYEAIGPGGTGFLIAVLTDNKNRTLGEIKITLKNHAAQLGSVAWLFENKTPKFPLQTDEATKQKIQTLINALEGLDDVEEVISNL